MIERIQEGCYRVASYFQRIRRLIRRSQEEASPQKPAISTDNSQQLGGRVAEEVAEIKEVKRTKRKRRTKKARRGSAKRQRTKRTKKKRASKSRR